MARERVIALLVDDGVANRGHRTKLFSTDYRVVGVACGGHKMGAMCVITFAGGFSDKANSAHPQPGRKAAEAKRF